MASANKVILLGHLGTKPEVAYTQGGTAVCNMRLATNHVYKDREGNKQEHTSWINLKSFGRQAEVCGQYLNKGRQIYVEGRLQTDSYEDGRGVRRTKAEVITNQVVFLSEQNKSWTEQPDRPQAHLAEPDQRSFDSGNGNGGGNGGSGNGDSGNGDSGNGGASSWAGSSGESIPMAEPAEDD
jgi:single-strand DNA-binding protein